MDYIIMYICIISKCTIIRLNSLNTGSTLVNRHHLEEMAKIFLVYIFGLGNDSVDLINGKNKGMHFSGPYGSTI